MPPSIACPFPNLTIEWPCSAIGRDGPKVRQKVLVDSRDQSANLLHKDKEHLALKEQFQDDQKVPYSQITLVVKKGFAQYLSYLNPKGQDSSFKIDGFIATYKLKLK